MKLILRKNRAFSHSMKGRLDNRIENTLDYATQMVNKRRQRKKAADCTPPISPNYQESLIFVYWEVSSEHWAVFMAYKVKQKIDFDLVAEIYRKQFCPNFSIWKKLNYQINSKIAFDSVFGSANKSAYISIAAENHHKRYLFICVGHRRPETKSWTNRIWRAETKNMHRSESRVRHLEIHLFILWRIGLIGELCDLARQLRH